MLQITSTGNFDKTDRFLAMVGAGKLYKALDAHAQRGVVALAAATPEDTGVTADSWYYDIDAGPGGCTIMWKNNHLDEVGTPIVVMLQYGHGTGTGGYVQGRDFINPAIKPVFDEIEEAVWKEVTS